MSQTKAQLLDGSVVSVSFGAGSAAAPSINYSANSTTGIYFPGSGQLAISTNGTGRLFIDSSGRLLVGTSTARSNFFGTTLSSLTQTEGTGGSTARGALSVINNDVSNNPPYVLLGRSGAATLGSNAVVVSGSRLGTLTFHGADGTNFIEAATVAGEVDGTPGSNDMPGRLVFSTTTDGAASPTERMRIDSAGTTTLTSAASTAPFVANISASEVARIDSGGKLLVGTSTARTNFAGATSPLLQIETATNSTNRAISILSGNSGVAPPILIFGRQTSDTIGGNTIVSSGLQIGGIVFQGSDGTNFLQAATIGAFVDGTPGTNDMPGRLTFSTTPDGLSVPIERMRITNDGIIAYNQQAPAAVDTTATLTIANLKTGIITSTSAAATDMTLPTGTDTDTGFYSLPNNHNFQWSVINTGPSLVRVLANTGHTVVGSGSVATGTSGRFASRKSTSNTYITYRLA